MNEKKILPEGTKMKKEKFYLIAFSWKIHQIELSLAKQGFMFDFQSVTVMRRGKLF